MKALELFGETRFGRLLTVSARLLTQLDGRSDGRMRIRAGRQLHQDVLRLDVVGVFGLPPAAYGLRVDPIGTRWTCTIEEEPGRPLSSEPAEAWRERPMQLGEHRASPAQRQNGHDGKRAA